MLKRTEGIVLKTTVFGEADLIVTYLTRDYGLLKVFAKSPRKTKSRFGSSLEPLTYSKISFFGKDNANLPKLTQSDIIRPFHSLRDNFKCFLNISEMLELGLIFLPEREPNHDALKLLLNFLVKLESDCGNRLYYLHYKMKFLEITGFSPKLDACGRCGGKLRTVATPGTVKAGHRFYMAHGSIICDTCVEAGEEAIKVSDGAVRFYRSFSRWDLSNISRLKAPESLLTEITGLMDSHIRYVHGLRKSPFKKAFER